MCLHSAMCVLSDVCVLLLCTCQSWSGAAPGIPDVTLGSLVGTGSAWVSSPMIKMSPIDLIAIAAAINAVLTTLSRNSRMSNCCR